jgi:hypothetical protein
MRAIQRLEVSMNPRLSTAFGFAAAFYSALAIAQSTPPENAAPPARSQSAAAGASASTAQQDLARDRELFRELDRNGDGYLSPSELAADRARSANWIAVDRNRDGRISPSEFRAVAPR